MWSYHSPSNTPLNLFLSPPLFYTHSLTHSYGVRHILQGHRKPLRGICLGDSMENTELGLDQAQEARKDTQKSGL